VLFRSIEFINIGEIHNRKHDETGFSSFLADRLVRIYGVENDRSKKDMLHAAIEYLKYRPKSAPAMVQLRGMYGRIFQEWVNDSTCDAWAWTDLDVIYGDLKGWIQSNSFVWDMNVFTLGGGDWTNLYTRGQFTAHVLKRNPKAVNNIWKYCSQFRTTHNLARAMVYSGLCIDEGCYGRAVFDSKLRFGAFPWQGNDWDNKKSDYVSQLDGRLWTVKSCSRMEDCRSQLQREIPVQSYRQNSLSARILQDGFETKHSSEVNITRKLFSAAGKSCQWWIAPEFKTCVDKNGYNIPSGSDWALVAYAGKVEMITWKTLDNKPKSSTVMEYLIFHFAHWKNQGVNFPSFNEESDTNLLELSILTGKR